VKFAFSIYITYFSKWQVENKIFCCFFGYLQANTSEKCLIPAKNNGPAVFSSPKREKLSTDGGMEQK